MSPEKRAQEIIAWYETLSPQNVENIHLIYSPKVHFKDPFREMHGLGEMREYFGGIFTKFDSLKFTVNRSIVQGPDICLLWTSEFKRPLMTSRVEGVFILHMDEKGLIDQHTDHWDVAAQVYEKIFFLGFFFRLFRKLIARFV